MDNLDDLKWNEDGLIPAVAQSWSSGEILMLAWMNKESLECSISEGRAVYWSRSRNQLWRKGEQSGFVQHIREIRIDCDLDTILIKVDQVGEIACHTGRRNCFFWRYSKDKWEIDAPIIKPTEQIYGNENE